MARSNSTTAMLRRFAETQSPEMIAFLHNGICRDKKFHSTPANLPITVTSYGVACVHNGMYREQYSNIPSVNFFRSRELVVYRG